MKKIVVKSRTEASDFTSEEPWIAISVSSHGEWPVLSKENRVSVLQLAFQDIEFKGRSGAISPEQAKKIVDFVAEHNDINNILIHCEAGLSRSPAIAAAIDKIYSGQNEKWFNDPYTPNQLVYNILLEAFKL